MRYIILSVLPSLIGASAQLAKASNSSELSLQTSFDPITYENERIGRSLGGTDCRSSVDVTCKIRNTGLSCADNLRVRRSDCVANNMKIPVPVNIEWRYCNDDTEMQLPNSNLLVPKFRKAVKEDPNTSKNLPAGQCRVITSKKNINVCKAGATMSMKYEGTIPSRPGSYCYNYKFLRVKKKWLPERECSVSTDIKCEMATGANVGEKCTGNIIRNAECEQVPVTFKYSTCLWNINPADVMTFDRQQSWIKMDGSKMIPAYDRTALAPKTQCRVATRDEQIDTCATKTVTSIQMAGSLASGTECKSSSKMRIKSATLCDFNFILTEIVHNANGATYVEIFSEDCPNQIVTEDYYITKYRGTSRNPSPGSISLHGITTDSGGFATFCLSFRVNKDYGDDSCLRVTGIQTAAHLNGSDKVAIIEGDPSSDFVILDIYGNPGVDLPDEFSYRNSRAVRRTNIMNQKEIWESTDWSIESDSATPRNWGSFGNFSPDTGDGNGNKNDGKDKDKDGNGNKNDGKDKDNNKDKDKDDNKNDGKDKDNNKDKDKDGNSNKNDGKDKDNNKDIDKDKDGNGNKNDGKDNNKDKDTNKGDGNGDKNDGKDKDINKNKDTNKGDGNDNKNDGKDKDNNKDKDGYGNKNDGKDKDKNKDQDKNGNDNKNDGKDKDTNKDKNGNGNKNDGKDKDNIKDKSKDSDKNKNNNKGKGEGKSTDY